jgi:EAL domain-containing protein (putative c-di-GMP-specific phosphodiesterase class I)/CRP-like cAMP-binding protein
MQQYKNTHQRIDLHQLRTTYAKGEVIFHEDDMRDNAYIIESGTVEISTTRQGRKVPLVLLGKGEVFGETALLGAGKRTATAIAIDDTEVFTISPRLLRDRIVRMDPLVGLLMSLLVNRYRQWRYKSPDAADGTDAAAENRTTGETEFPATEPADDFMSELFKQKKIALDDLRLAQEMTGAIAGKQFEAYLQPIMTLPERKIAGYEALVRWHHPTRGILQPLEFIPVAERTSVIRELDMMMLTCACETIPRLPSPDGRKLYIGVNLSGALFDETSIVDEIRAILRASDADPSQLLLEITESALMGDPAVAERILCDIKDLGVRIALDDFGTGYSSLGYLHRYPIDIIKIDRSFVRGLQHNRKSMDIVRAIASLARTFQLQIVGEGAEEEGEVLALAGIGCDYAQGYFFGKPKPVKDTI